jgi:SSS family solute:Na+ symporter
MKKWAYIMGTAGVLMIVVAIIVILMGQSTTLTAYLNDIGFQAFIFFGVLVGCNAVWLYSNATDSKQDEKALPINLSLFATTRGYTYGTIGIVVITALLYIILW